MPSTEPGMCRYVGMYTCKYTCNMCVYVCVYFTLIYINGPNHLKSIVIQKDSITISILFLKLISLKSGRVSSRGRVN